MIDRTTLKVGDIVRIRVNSSDPSSIRIATIVNTDNNDTPLSLLDEPYYTNGLIVLSHSQVWADPKSKLQAIQLGLSDDGRERSWYINRMCDVLEILNRAGSSVAKEAPCQICQRANDTDVKICYWCGEQPFGKLAS